MQKPMLPFLHVTGATFKFYDSSRTGSNKCLLVRVEKGIMISIPKNYKELVTLEMYSLSSNGETMSKEFSIGGAALKVCNLYFRLYLKKMF